MQERAQELARQRRWKHSHGLLLESHTHSHTDTHTAAHTATTQIGPVAGAWRRTLPATTWGSTRIGAPRRRLRRPRHCHSQFAPTLVPSSCAHVLPLASGVAVPRRPPDVRARLASSARSNSVSVRSCMSCSVGRGRLRVPAAAVALPAPASTPALPLPLPPPSTTVAAAAARSSPSATGSKVSSEACICGGTVRWLVRSTCGSGSGTRTGCRIHRHWWATSSLLLSPRVVVRVFAA